jgi:hypothetical protein
LLNQQKFAAAKAEIETALRLNPISGLYQKFQKIISESLDRMSK